MVSPLRAGEVYHLVKSSDLKSFKTTASIPLSHNIISQERAVKAIEMGLGIQKPGYNIYAAGIQGTGHTSVIKGFLKKWAANSTTPQDSIYVYDFENRETPKLIHLKPGKAKVLRNGMEDFIQVLAKKIPTVLQAEEFESRANERLNAASDRKNKLLVELEKIGRGRSFYVKTTENGIETIPMSGGEILNEESYEELTAKEKDEIEKRRAELEPHVLEFARQVRSIDTESRAFLEEIKKEFVHEILSEELVSLRKSFKNNEEVTEYFDHVTESIVENIQSFMVEDPKQGQVPSYDPLIGSFAKDQDRFRRYRVNVFVDHGKTKGAPIVFENNPTYYNLFGKIEKNVENGMYHTDYTMIQSGAVHKANGGYLVLNAADVFKQYAVWENLKKILRTRSGFIEDIGENYSMVPTTGMKPEPMELDLKIIMIGNEDIYHQLFTYDEDFPKIFKIKADFDYKMKRSKKNMNAYVDFIASRCKVEDLLPFSRSGVSCMVEYGSRIADDKNYLSTQFGQLKDLTIEADFIARQASSKVVDRKHVMGALDQKFYRLNSYEDYFLEMIAAKGLEIDFKGKKIGQTYGLAVLDYGDYSFGKVCKISANSYMSNRGIINIERSANLSGNIHEKGVSILSAYLNSIISKKKSIGFGASVCFEQSYGKIDGDSATVTELVAITSSLSNTPVEQCFAMTGSVDQSGNIQPVGGVNEKIEGFYRTCKAIKSKKPFKLMLPYQNVTNLMLHHEVVEAVKSKELIIYPIKTFPEAFKLVTGVDFGIKTLHDKKIKKDSAVQRIIDRFDVSDEEDEKK